MSEKNRDRESIRVRRIERGESIRVRRIERGESIRVRRIETERERVLE